MCSFIISPILLQLYFFVLKNFWVRRTFLVLWMFRGYCILLSVLFCGFLIVLYMYLYRWSKTARSLPESSRRPQLQREWTFHSIDAEDLTNAAIPYRLPRIDTPRDSFCRFEHDPENVWTRHGYQNQIK